MGLDMYLDARVRTYKPFYDGEPDALRQACERAADAVGLPASDNLDYIETSREIGYWRKANQIHQWFVDNVQNGEDECRPHYVSRDKLTELRSVCQKIIDQCTLEPGPTVRGNVLKPGVGIVEKDIETKVMTNQALAAELLPVQSGFFFGSTEYDEWYMADITATIEIIDRCLALPHYVDFEYRSSW